MFLSPFGKLRWVGGMFSSPFGKLFKGRGKGRKRGGKEGKRWKGRKIQKERKIGMQERAKKWEMGSNKR